MKLTPCLLVFLLLCGIAHAQDSKVSFPDLMSQIRFSNEPLSTDVTRASGNQGFPTHHEPTASKSKMTRPSVLVGLGLIATGAVLAATAGESATVTTFNPVTQQSMTSTVSVTNDGKRWVGIGLLGSGGVLTFLGLTK